MTIVLLLVPAAAAVGALLVNESGTMRSVLLAFVPGRWIALWLALSVPGWFALTAMCSGWSVWRSARTRGTASSVPLFDLFFAAGLLFIAHLLASTVASAIFFMLTNNAWWLE